jgi:ankyrin repeat protein
MKLIVAASLSIMIISTTHTMNIFQAITANNSTAVDELITADQSIVHCHNAYGLTPLHMAAAYGKIVILNLLMNENADLNTQDHQGRTALVWAIKQNKEEAALILLGAGASFELPDRFCKTPLWFATKHNLTALVQTLIEKKADLNVADQRNGRSPLHWAAYHGNSFIMQQLINAGALINRIDNDKKTPLQLAYEHSPQAQTQTGPSDSPVDDPQHKDSIQSFSKTIAQLLAAGATVKS